MFQKLSSSRKLLLAISYDFVMTIFSFEIALLLRIGDLSLISLKNNLVYLTVVGCTQMLIFFSLGFYKGVWRYSSTYDLIRLIKGTALGCVTSLIILFMYNRLYDVPRTVFITDWLFLIVLLGGGRLGYRVFRDSVNFKNQSTTARKVLIIGAGSSGEQIFREIKNNPSLDLRVIGFIDDDPQLQNKTIHNCPILGKVEEIEEVTRQCEVDLIYIAIPSGTSEEINRIYEYTKSLNIPAKILPKFGDIINGNIKLSHFRNIEVQDILGRKEVKLDNSSIKSMLKDKTILITGAGGSIGSEIVRQVAIFSPSKLILVDSSEFNLYQLEKDLQSSFPNIKYSIHMLDIRNEAALKSVFTLKPDVIFHAAAYKHVPLVESNPYAGVQTNIRGTQILATLANKYNIKKFVLISSDKAVNPTNIMGATKRIAELICLNEQSKSETTKFVTVRFGNVLGSSGSVIPLFKKQIEQGGPITVTHPEIKRYFMSIPEASQLVLQAGSIGQGGEIFVLEMGEPIYILDIAKQMISLSGHTENEIQISFVGLRPGEKMYEELLLDGETTLQTTHPMVMMAKASKIPPVFEKKLASLLELGAEEEVSNFKIKIKDIISQYVPATLKDSVTVNSSVENNLH
ncbi:hypothetical protein A9Q84_05155 [Halobacteriovorax marinus]|uniref:Polysaccharide biosynthesis protein CapD-like domain-containing protein n=1 Tax=Halobacteriovorax marinus TaxID=97084 RepID=A0A1Y5FGJ7_9BACT|nr:hypothetical protein A9Q84_05155 [Halobacteriovorax marinus]